MRGMQSWKALLIVFVGAVFVLAALQTPGFAQGDEVQHGIGFTKGCTSPVKVGNVYSCSYSIRNLIDEAEDTLTIHSLIDVAHGAGGDVSSGDFFADAHFDDAGTSATCTGGTGSGTVADPWVGATSCTLPFGSRLNVQSHSFYVAQPDDFNLPNHVLTDSATLGWHDLCDDPAHTGDTNCNPNPPPVGAASQATVQKTVVAITTALSPRSPVRAGTTVTDQATLTGATPSAGGTVSYAVYADEACQTLVQALGTKGVTDGAVDPSDPWTASEGDFWFQARYSGDGANLGATSDCTSEPMSVVTTTTTTSTTVSTLGSTTTSSPPVTEQAASTTSAPLTTTTAVGTTASGTLPRTGNPIGLELLIGALLVGFGLWMRLGTTMRRRMVRRR